MENLGWFTARSCANTSCVEVAFRKSSYSSDTANCVEIGRTVDTVYVRDSKAGNDGTVLAFPPGDWRKFLAALPARPGVA